MATAPTPQQGLYDVCGTILQEVFNGGYYRERVDRGDWMLQPTERYRGREQRGTLVGSDSKLWELVTRDGTRIMLVHRYTAVDASGTTTVEDPKWVRRGDDAGALIPFRDKAHHCVMCRGHR